jgi:hypothetical protein
MEIIGLDIQKKDNRIVACIRHKGGATVTLSEDTEPCFLTWFWNTIQTEGLKGSFEGKGEWR